MKRGIAIILFIVINLTASGQDKTPLTLNWGLMIFGDTILIDDTEILTGYWLDFIYYNNPQKYPSYINNKKLTEDEEQKLLKQKIDTSLVPDLSVIGALPGSYIFKDCSNKKLISFSSVSYRVKFPVNADSLNNKESKKRLKKYLNTPITGITYEQALKFCKWRTTTDSLKYYPRFIDGTYMSPHSSESYVFSLPTPDEYDALNPNQDSIANKKGIIANFNYKNAIYSNTKKRESKNKDCGRTLMHYDCFFYSNKSVRSSTTDMQGNAAEMTSVKGIAKGGSYCHYAKDSKKGINNYYTRPEVWLGFRCVAKRRKK